jgi:hypothetical protein
MSKIETNQTFVGEESGNPGAHILEDSVRESSLGVDVDWEGFACDLSSLSEMSVICSPFNFVHSSRMNRAKMRWDIKRGRIDPEKEEISELTQIDDDQDLKWIASSRLLLRNSLGPFCDDFSQPCLCPIGFSTTKKGYLLLVVFNCFIVVER